MIHFLTIGKLDLVALHVREVKTLGPLPEEVGRVLSSMLDDPSNTEEPTLGGHPVVVREDTIRCVWYAPRRNRACERLAVEALRLGCVVADVERARLVSLEELTSGP